jgi:outer membrane immunogenic protein
MRWWVCGLLIAMACPALAADYDDSWLRGSQDIGLAPAPPPRPRIWAGVYGGVQVGEDFHGIDFREFATNPLAGAANQDAILKSLGAGLPGIPILPVYNTKGPSYGGFLGYNWQIDDVVAGVELNANRSSVSAIANSTVSHSFINNALSNTYNTAVTVASAGTAEMSDYFTVRGRMGWAFGNFLPYIAAGASFAQIDTTSDVNINYTAICIPNPPQPCPDAGAKYQFPNVSHGKYIIGFDAAAGIDYLLTNNVFTRGEVEYLQLGTPNAIRMNTVSVRIALGLKY